MFKRFQWSGDLGIHNIVELSTLSGQGINRTDSLNFFGYWKKRETIKFSYSYNNNYFFQNEIWTMWIDENEVAKWIDNFRSFDYKVYTVITEYFKFRRDSIINKLLDGY